MRDQRSAALESTLLGFSLPTAARRAADAARFLEEGEQWESSTLMDRQGVLWGKALSHAARQQWPDVAVVLNDLATLEDGLASRL